MEITLNGQTQVANVFKRLEDVIITEFCEKYNIYKINKHYSDIDDMCGEFIDHCSVTMEFYTNLRNVNLEDLESVIYKFKDEKHYTIQSKIYGEHITVIKNDKPPLIQYIYNTWKNSRYNKEMECFTIHIMVNH
jgi:hypothetical protein